MKTYLDFERPLQELEMKIEELRQIAGSGDGAPNMRAEISSLERKAEALRQDIFSRLTPWQRAQIARHPERPYTLDYIQLIAKDFLELHGDRRFSDDPSIVGGFGRIDEQAFLLIGHQKGRGTKERITRNFGQPNPEGYRKALRLMKLAERMKKPVITFIDTPGAFPGIGAEERGQSEAIADNLMQMSRVKVPIISVVIGEGGSGGALAIAVADRVLMLEHAIYSVISPEGCAAILWRKEGELGKDEFARAAAALKLTADDLLQFKVIDAIIKEPPGGAQCGPRCRGSARS
ncbi:MAG: acetyl-CoA carboxylase carboxyltransferase subunit alpha, partial [Thermodesulfovibrionales bacterium]